MADIAKTIHSTAPIRICDIGGWTDTWFAGHGKVFNIAVTPNVDVRVSCVPDQEEGRVTFHLDNLNQVYTIGPDRAGYGKHPTLEAMIDEITIPSGHSLEVQIFSNAPSGASVGSSAAVSVALLGALLAFEQGGIAQHEIAARAHRIETEKVGLQSGIQDQYCCACGGIHLIEMPEYPEAKLHKLEPSSKIIEALENRLSLIYINQPHFSSEVHQKVIADLGPDASIDPRIDGLRALAVGAKEALMSGDLVALGDIMSKNTDLQRSLHADLVCEKFEEIIRLTSLYNVLGCKVNGAGGDGGSITILGDGDEEKKKRMIQELEAKGFQSIPIALSANGVRIREDRWHN